MNRKFSRVLPVLVLVVCAGCQTVVQLPPGEVVLTETKLLSAADSGTIFRGASDGSTRLSGGLEIIGWVDRGNGVWSAILPSDAFGHPVYSETLFVNGRRAKRCRWPEDGFFQTTAVSQQADATSSTGWRQRVRMPEDLAKLMADIPAKELPFAQLLAHVRWDVARYPISTCAQGELTTEGIQMTGWRTWRTNEFFCVENVRTAFKKPGEWFYDGCANTIFYRPLPGEKIEHAVFPRDGLETLIAVKGDPELGKPVRDITFENVTFAFTAPTQSTGPTRLAPHQAAAIVSTAAIVLDGAQDVVFRNCRFEHLGSYAVWYRAGCRGGGVFDCELTDLGAGGVRIGTQDRLRAGVTFLLDDGLAGDVPFVETASWMTSDITVDNCLIAHGGRFHPAGIGVLLTHASDCQITHNDIFDLFYTGISVGWVWGYAGSPAQRNLIGWNHIYKIGQGHLADMGGIYTLGASFGTRLVGNVIHDIHSYSYGGWGLYNDEGSEGIVLEDNIVWGTDDASYHQHYGKDNVLRNNILCDSASGQVAVTRPENHRSLTCENNIIIWSSGDAFNQFGYAGTRDEKAKIDWRNNTWWCATGKDAFNKTPFAAWQQRVGDKGSLFANPGFANWQQHDFTLPPDSPAIQNGFRPFDWSLAGRRK